MPLNQAHSSMKRPVARGKMHGKRSGTAVPVTLHEQAQARSPHITGDFSMSLPAPEERGNRKRKGIVLLVILVIFLLVAFAGYKILDSEMSALLDVNTVYHGIQLENQNFGGKTKEDMAAFAAEQEEEKNQAVLFRIVLDGNDPISVKLGDLNPQYNTDQVIEEAYEYGREGNKISRYITVRNLEAEPKNFAIDYQIKESAIDKLVRKAAKTFNSNMSNASVIFKPDEEKMFTVKGGKNGVEIDQELLKSNLTAALEQKSSEDIQVSASIIKPEISEEDALANTKLMAQFSTNTTGEYNRDTNIKLAAAAFNGSVVQPGEIFSINECTGKRTIAKGYKSAGAIKNGKMIQDTGGGVCQVSSTLYGAVIRADLEIVTRHPHRWRSAYVPVGQDAAIDWPSADFKFKNNTDHPIYLRSTKIGTKLTVYIYGQPLKWDKIEVVSYSTGTLYAGSPRVIQDSSLASGVKVVETKTRNGETAQAYRVYYKDGKEHHREKLPDTRHEPVQGVVRVGTGAAKKPTESSSDAPKKDNDSSSTKPKKDTSSSKKNTSSKAEEE